MYKKYIFYHNWLYIRNMHPYHPKTVKNQNIQATARDRGKTSQAQHSRRAVPLPQVVGENLRGRADVVSDSGQVLSEGDPALLLLRRVQVLDAIEGVAQPGESCARVTVADAWRHHHVAGTRTLRVITHFIHST